MKTLFTVIIAALVMSNSVFAGAGTLFKGGIGLPDWSLASSAAAMKPPAKRAVTRTSLASNSKPTDRRLTSR